MGREQRLALVAEIERLRGTKVITYVLGDRAPAGAQIGDDAVRPIHDHLRALGHVNKLDLFIYSRGGAIDVPWRLNTALRRTAERWSALVPFRANSAATLLCLRADEIVLGRQGELGPIDPIMNMTRPSTPGAAPVQDTVSVEDVMAYTRFVRERCGLSDQASLTAAMSKLADRLDPVALGNAFRTHSHIRYVARHMLLSRRERAAEQAIDTIVDTLAERVYAHGHAVGLEEAKEIGLHAISGSDELDDAMWALLGEYERDMKLLEPIDPAEVLEASDQYRERAVVGLIDSTWGYHEFAGNINITAKRQLPQSLQVSVNAPLQLPAGIQPEQFPQALQQLMANLQQTLAQQAQAAVQEALRQQAPIAGTEVRFTGAQWRLVSPAQHEIDLNKAEASPATATGATSPKPTRNRRRAASR